ncbi:MAG: PIN/TRAM domain-containing protein [Anaerolineae bacterium]|nr:MAG: PIN/TRAM domain-containing protein [Anaerolineae bacterium]
MSIEFLFRIIGMFAFAIGGVILGVRLSTLAGGAAELWGMVLAMVGALLGLVLAPYLTTRPLRAIRRRMSQVSAQTMVAGLAGLIAGLLIAALVSAPISLLPSPFGQLLPFVSAIFLGYLGATIFIMRENDITNILSSRFQSSPDESGERSQNGRSILMDTSVIIDGRIADIARTGFVLGPMLVPAFVLIELQHIADSSDPLRRRRGRRGLDILNRLQKDNTIPLRITDLDVEGVREVDDKLVILGKQLRSPILTNDYNLNRVAELQGVTVLNINELANAVKAVYLPGETMEVQVIQEGKEVGQGVGYLDDGTMVVIEDGKGNINKTIPVTVTKVLQTAAGRMIFAKPGIE